MLLQHIARFVEHYLPWPPVSRSTTRFTRRQRKGTMATAIETIEDRLLLTTWIWIPTPEDGGPKDFNGDFNDSTHWVTEETLNFLHADHVHGVPGGSDTAIINGNGEFTVTVNTAASVGTLSSVARIHVTSGSSLIINSGTSSTIQGVTLDAGGELGVEGDGTKFVVGSGELSGDSTYAGTLHAGAGAMLLFGGIFAGHDLNAGTTFTGSGLFSRTGFNIPSFTINAPLTFPENFELGNGTMTMNADVTVGGTFRQFLNGSGGTLLGSGDLIVPNGATYTWEGARIEGGGGRFIIQAGGTLNISAEGDARFLTTRTIDNAGTINWSSGGIAGVDTTITNLGSGIVNVSGDHTLNSGDSITFNNMGTFIKTSSAAPGTASTLLGVIFNNTGTVNVDSGILKFSRGTSSGVVNAAAGTQVVYRGGTGVADDYTYDSGATFTGSGTLLVIDEAVFVINTDLVVENFEQSSNIGKVTGTGNLTISGHHHWINGRIDGAGELIILNGATLDVGVEGGATPERVVNNSGIINWSGTNYITVFATAGVINNLPDGVFNINADAGTNVLVNNQGTLNKTTSGALGTTTFFAGITNTGTVQVTSGKLQVNPAYTQSDGTTIVNAGATLATSNTVNITGGSLSGTGTISGNLTNAGLVSPGSSPGRLAVTGSYLQSATGILSIEIGGLTPGSQYDQLAVGGNANLDGTLQVTFIDGFVPAVANRFSILEFGSNSNNFATEEGLDIPGSSYLQSITDVDSLDLLVKVNTNPSFTSSSSFSIAENSTTALTVAATDADLPAQVITYSISGGADQGLFSITPTGALTFVSAPDFETQLDSDLDNQYEVQVSAGDGAGGVTVQDLTVTVTNVADGPQLSGGGSIVTWVKKNPPVVVLPQVTVTSGVAGLAGATLTLATDIVVTKKKALDQFHLPSSGAIGTISNPVILNGRLTVHIELNENATDAAVQAFLRGITFSTSGAGLKKTTRSVAVTLADTSGQSATINRTISVRKKAVV